MRHVENLLEKITQFSEFWKTKTSDEAKQMANTYIHNLIEEADPYKREYYSREWEKNKLRAISNKTRETTNEYYKEKNEK